MVSNNANCDFVRRSFTVDSIQDVLEFSRTCGIYPFYPQDLIKQFLTNLISSECLVFDYFCNNVRVGTAVLIDKISNKGNTANLEFVGLNHKCDHELFFDVLFKDIASSFPTNKDAIEVSFHETYPISQDYLTKRGYVPYYSGCEMNAIALKNPMINFPSNATFQELSVNNFDEYYRVVKKTFEHNPDGNFSTENEMKQRINDQKIPAITLSIDGKIVGFFNVKIDSEIPDTGEVNIMGVLPEYRGQGLGKVLLNKAMKYLQSHGARNFKLSVNTENEKALNLYKAFGFKVTDRYTSYICKRYKEHKKV